MAKFVLAGRADCPYFAKAEILADFLQINLPNFKVHKICQHPKDWERWLEVTCAERGWKHGRSPIVWRELIDRGGKGMLLGGFNKFLEHAQGYYGLTSDMRSELMLRIAAENLQTKELCMEEEEHFHSLVQPLHVWISGSLKPTCYNLIPLLFEAGVLGDAPSVSLHLLDVGGSEEALEGLRMETEDLALPRLHQVTAHTTLDQAFLHAHVVLVLDDPESAGEGKGEGETEREAVIENIVERFTRYGQLIDARAHRDVRVVVAGHSFVNLKCAILQENAPSLDGSRFVAMATLLENEARAQLAQKLNVKTADVTDVIVWGNIGGSYHIDLQRAKVFRCEGAIWGPPSFAQPILERIHDWNWLESDFVNLVASRYDTVVTKTQRAAALSVANGIATVLRAWHCGSTPGEVFSLGILSTGQFGLPAGLAFSMPVSFKDGSWAVLEDISMSEELQNKLQAAANQLKVEDNTNDTLNSTAGVVFA
ncbi:putative malate dehydrogenase 1B [Megalops cyprinoides]|uniref:putative malate dehydrogenase 1B n=1 Tax=Megalops cyprinoides TaxID=118141 RepID=UPI001864D1F3|nr:putative malate dehydrogenase 1B [Megalops cyprinoides]